MLGIVFSLLSAAFFGLNSAAARRAVLSGSVLSGLAITVPLGVPLFLAATAIAGELSRIVQLPAVALLWFALAGIVHFVLGRSCNYLASRAIGSNLAAPWMQCDVIVTLVLAIWILGEHLTMLRIIGIALILVGPSLVATRERAPAVSADSSPAAKPIFEPRYTEGYTYALLAALCYGISPILIGLGLSSAGGTGVIAGGLVSYLAATLVVGIVVLAAGRIGRIYNVSRSALGWFLLAGVAVCVSQIFRYAAIALAPVSVVTTLQRLSTIFRFYFGWLINREHEVFDKSIVLATIVSLTGAVILAISTDAFLALADWPPWLVALARWQWP